MNLGPRVVDPIVDVFDTYGSVECDGATKAELVWSHAVLMDLSVYPLFDLANLRFSIGESYLE